MNPLKVKFIVEFEQEIAEETKEVFKENDPKQCIEEFFIHALCWDIEEGLKFTISKFEIEGD